MTASKPPFAPRPGEPLDPRSSRPSGQQKPGVLNDPRSTGRAR